MHWEQVRLHYAKWKMGRKEGAVDMVRLDDGTLKPHWGHWRSNGAIGTWKNLLN
jgi:hypothetical protein